MFSDKSMPSISQIFINKIEKKNIPSKYSRILKTVPILFCDQTYLIQINEI